MEGVKVTIDRIVVEFRDIYWEFFNPFKLRLRQYLNASLSLKEKGFKYHLHVRDGGHYLHISYQLTFVPKSRKNTLRIECHPDSLVSNLNLYKLPGGGLEEGEGRESTFLRELKEETGFDAVICPNEILDSSL